jgi:uncharacterized protein (DUF2237 family)
MVSRTGFQRQSFTETACGDIGFRTLVSGTLDFGIIAFEKADGG